MVGNPRRYFTARKVPGIGVAGGGHSGADLQIKGNWIGTSRLMNGNLGNTQFGIYVGSGTNIKLGGNPADGNVIANSGDVCRYRFLQEKLFKYGAGFVECESIGVSTSRTLRAAKNSRIVARSFARRCKAFRFTFDMTYVI